MHVSPIYFLLRMGSLTNNLLGMLHNQGTSSQFEFNNLQRRSAKPSGRDKIVDIIHGPHRKNRVQTNRDGGMTHVMNPGSGRPTHQYFTGRTSLEPRRDYNPISGMLV